ncbi:MAG: NAD-dependent epimerase/dehydratase family protein [Gammaproteobacteria bacterium]|nr:NAD-dependent epimerase/dehydratase family protein [Gammaproteobacteria bacterium]
MARALITGAGGFVGPYLARFLGSRGYEVHGSTKSGEPSPDYRSVALDVSRAQDVADVVADIAPQEIYHLAGISRPFLGRTASFYDVNLNGTIHILDAARTVGAKMLAVGSAYVYGRYERPVNEQDLLQPINHYGVSKAAADMAVLGYALDGLHVIRARPFNHSGPGQSPDFVLPTLVRQLVRIEAGLEPPFLKLGNVDSVRDFCDVRDMVRGYWMLMDQGISGTPYNLCSGRGVSIRELFEQIRALVDVEVEIEIEAARVRSTDTPYMVGDNRRLYAATQWTLEYSLEQTLRDMVAFERQRIEAESDAHRPLTDNNEKGKCSHVRCNESLQNRTRLRG